MSVYFNHYPLKRSFNFQSFGNSCAADTKHCPKWNPKQNKTKMSPILKIAGSISPGWTSQLNQIIPWLWANSVPRRIFVWDLLGNVENILFRLSLLALGLFSHVRCESSHYNQVVKKKTFTFWEIKKSFLTVRCKWHYRKIHYEKQKFNMQMFLLKKPAESLRFSEMCPLVFCSLAQWPLMSWSTDFLQNIPWVTNTTSLLLEKMGSEDRRVMQSRPT